MRHQHMHTPRPLTAVAQSACANIDGNALQPAAATLSPEERPSSGSDPFVTDLLGHRARHAAQAWPYGLGTPA
jgi:hypothetical protein